MEQLSETQIAINKAISKMPWCDAWVLPGPFNTLVLGLSVDIDYYHTIEIAFDQTLFSKLKHTLRIDVSKGLFQPIADIELPDLGQECLVEAGYQIFRLMDEDGNLYYVVADHMDATFDIVYHYRNDDLKEGERVANWVRESE